MSIPVPARGRAQRTFTPILALIAFTGACGGGAPPAERGAASQRRIISSAWDTAFIVASNARDSSLLMPFRPVATSDGVYLADFYGNAVLHFDAAGHLAWRFGKKGSGPDEFRRIRDVKLDSSGRVWVLDQINQRLTVLNPGGIVSERISLARLALPPQGVVPLRNGEAVILTFDPQSPFVRVAANGTVTARSAFPWKRFHSLNFLASQYVSAAEPTSGHWAVAFQMGDGFFPFRDTAWLRYRGTFVEKVGFPEVQEVRNGSSVATQFSTRPVFAAKSISLSPSSIYVLFGGETPEARRVVDSYRLSDGVYLGSYLLPRPVDEIAWGGGALYVVYSDPYPTLALWRVHTGTLQ